MMKNDDNTNTLPVSESEGEIPLVRDARRLANIQLRVLGRTDKLNRRGEPCSRLELGNLAGTLTTVIHHNQLSPRQRQLEHGDIVQVSGELLEVADRIVLRTERLHGVETPDLQPAALLPKAWALPAFLPPLRTVLRHWYDIGNPSLQRFLAEVFLDPSTALGFLNVPASQRFHHAYQGGLLDHTADMLTTAEALPFFRKANVERDLATVLVLLHDLGKTVTLVGQHRTERGDRQPHEMAALELLAAPLAQLEMTDGLLANRIRGYFKPRNWFPRQPDPVYHVVSHLDRSSAQNGEGSSICPSFGPFTPNVS